jgi:hypothetical protein
MAKVLGQSGRYVSDEAARQRRIILGVAFTVIALLGLLLGVIMSSFLPLEWMAPWARLALMSVAIFAIVAVDAWGEQKLDSAQRRSDAMLRGAAGEIVVGNILAGLPDDYHVINDLSTPTGNIDHVVIGPKGVFLLDAKNWRGVVAADDNGELLLNGRPTDKPHVQQYAGRVMLVQSEVIRRSPGTDAFFNAVFVFTAARIEAKWGCTGKVHCVRDDELQKYIVSKECSKELKPAEVAALARVFLDLAKLDKGFSTASPAEPEVKQQPGPEEQSGEKLVF